MSKGCIEDQALFGSELRRAFLNALAPRLFSWGKSVNAAALNALTNWNIDGDVLDAAVLMSSEREGVHPTETLFRLMDGEFSRAREEAALTSPLSDGFASIRTKLESLRKLEGAVTGEPTLSKRVQQLRRSELYRGEINVAGLPLPSGHGDIWQFDFESGVKRFVLVAQPCDFFVRSDGRRSQEWALLVPIRDEKGSTLDTVVELPYFDEPTLKSRWLALKRARVANAKLLDVVALGGPKIDSGKISELRELAHVHAAVTNRARVVVEWLDAALRDPSQTISHFVDGGEFAKFTRGPLLDFHCERIRRLHPELAHFVLQRYGQFVARHAMPHDFANLK